MCQCPAPAFYSVPACPIPATQEDMLCDACRECESCREIRQRHPLRRRAWEKFEGFE
jgi:hypothetical protein